MHAPADCDKAIEELLDVLEWTLWQACGPRRKDDAQEMDSMALSSYADGIRLLAAYGRVTITEEAGRRVIAVGMDADTGGTDG